MKIKTNEYGVITIKQRHSYDPDRSVSYSVEIPGLHKLIVEFYKVNSTIKANISYETAGLTASTYLRGKTFKYDEYDIRSAKKWVDEINDITKEQRDKILSFSINEKLLNYLYIRLFKDFEIKASKHKHRVSKNGKSVKD